MTFKDWDECLKFLEVLTKWPPIVLMIALVFRSAIAKKIAEIEKITVKEKAEVAFKTLAKLKKVAAETSPELFSAIHTEASSLGNHRGRRRCQ